MKVKKDTTKKDEKETRREICASNLKEANGKRPIQKNIEKQDREKWEDAKRKKEKSGKNQQEEY